MGRIVKVKCPYCGEISQGDVKEVVDDWLPVDPVMTEKKEKRKKKEKR